MKIAQKSQKFWTSCIEAQIFNIFEKRSWKPTLSIHQEDLKDNCQKVFSHHTPSQSRLETFEVKSGIGVGWGGGGDHPMLCGIRLL